MDKLFITILNNALVASWIILAVIICRQLFRKAPKWINCVLWGLVAIRLIIPFSIESIFSLVPSAKPVPVDIEYAKVPQINSGIPAINTIVNPVLENNFVADEIASANPMQIVIFILSHVWIIGVAGLFIYAVVSSFMIKRRVRTAQLIEKGIYECDNIESPFILGIVRPRVYVPVCMDKESYECVLEHEKAHIKRLDHIWKPLGFLILAVYWFNPLCWIAYIMLCKDIEYACDERVTRDKDKDWKAKYCQVLLDCSSQRRLVSACPVAFGEVSVKDRIKSVINYKKPAFWIIVAAVVISVIVAVCFMTNPRKEESAEKESLIGIADVDENDSDIVEYNIDKNQLFVKFWATAFCKKDSEVLYKYSSDDVRTALALEKVNDEYVLGESSPWPRDGWYSIEELHDNSAMIDYYAVTPDSHVTVWRQYITFSIDETDKENDLVKTVNTKKYENIVLGSDFDLAYSNGLLWMDYNKNGFGEKLNSKALLSSSLTYKDLFEPDTAARYFLNLLKNDKKVPIEVIDGANENEKILNITFMEDNQVKTVKMVRPWGNSGIWIPGDIENEDILKAD